MVAVLTASPTRSRVRPHVGTASDRHNARRIFECLRDEYGYTGGETVVKDAVRDWRISRREVFLTLSHPPGEAQVDFGEATVRIAGKKASLDLTAALQQG
jgi:hypothetical protein